jgi:hypothetical protein
LWRISNQLKVNSEMMFLRITFTLISFRWIITAGHCQDDLVVAVLGEHDFTVENDTVAKIVFLVGIVNIFTNDLLRQGT